jgi:hypothetical protein
MRTLGAFLARFQRKPFSVYGLLAVGAILIIEPALPQYHFSPFWFSLGVISAAIALLDVFRKE